MSAQSIAERLWKRQFSSEAARQELIERRAKSIAQDLIADLPKDDKVAHEVCDDIPGHMDTITIASLSRAALRGDAETVIRIVNAETKAAAERIADGRAIKQVDAMAAEDFLPD